jgi:hypothetical protein
MLAIACFFWTAVVLEIYYLKHFSHGYNIVFFQVWMSFFGLGFEHGRPENLEAQDMTKIGGH